jgi:hypothetical protein
MAEDSNRAARRQFLPHAATAFPCAWSKRLRVAFRIASKVLAVVFLLQAVPAGAQERNLEYAIKATFLYKFVPFVDWPVDVFAAPGEAVDICIIGPDPFGGLLDEAVAGQEIGARSVLVHRSDILTEESACDVLFASGAAAQQALDFARGRPILTVTDASSGDEAIGIVHFVIAGNRVAFDIDTIEANNNGLQISARLLALARSVRVDQ